MIKRYINLAIGLVLYAFGIVFTVNANLGLAPWDALHIGLSNHLGLTFGQVSIIVGLFVLVINYYFYESIGIGTVLNIFAIGIFIDFIFAYNLIPLTNNFWHGVLMLVIGMFLIAIASYFYIGSRFGTGPRDGLMVALSREKGIAIGLVRGFIEICVLILGYLLGAKIGIGTVILAFGIGPIIHFTFKILKFNVQDLHHDSFIFRKKVSPLEVE